MNLNKVMTLGMGKKGMTSIDIKEVEFWRHLDGPDVWRKREEQKWSSGFKNYLLQCTIHKGNWCKNSTSFLAFFHQGPIGVVTGRRPFK